MRQDYRNLEAVEIAAPRTAAPEKRQCLIRADDPPITPKNSPARSPTVSLAVNRYPRSAKMRACRIESPSTDGAVRIRSLRPSSPAQEKKQVRSGLSVPCRRRLVSGSCGVRVPFLVLITAACGRASTRDQRFRRGCRRGLVRQELRRQQEHAARSNAVALATSASTDGLSLAQAAAALAVSPRTLRQWRENVRENRSRPRLRGRRAARYEWRIPLLNSGHSFALQEGSGMVGMRGSFWVNLETYDVIRLEMNAVKTYDMTLERARDQGVRRTLLELRESHDRRAARLQEALLEAGVEPVKTSSVWSAVSRLIQRAEADGGQGTKGCSDRRHG